MTSISCSHPQSRCLCSALSWKPESRLMWIWWGCLLSVIRHLICHPPVLNRNLMGHTLPMKTVYTSQSTHLKPSWKVKLVRHLSFSGMFTTSTVSNALPWTWSLLFGIRGRCMYINFWDSNSQGSRWFVDHRKCFWIWLRWISVSFEVRNGGHCRTISFRIVRVPQNFWFQLTKPDWKLWNQGLDHGSEWRHLFLFLLLFFWGGGKLCLKKGMNVWLKSLKNLDRLCSYQC